MKEEKKDLFSYLEDSDAICITTNPHYSEDGIALMGGGCAGEAARRWEEVPKNLGLFLETVKLNIPYIIGSIDLNGNYIQPSRDIIKNNKYKCLIISFPTIHNLMNGADLDLIVESAKLLVILSDKFNLKRIILPRPGAGIGGLDWYRQVKPVIADILDDRFIICCQDHDEFYED